MNTKELKEKLLARQQELREHSEKSKQTRAPVELDQTRMGRLSRQDALMQQSMAEATERKREAELVKIKSALDRINTEDYGFCIVCDERISEARLQNDPAVSTCIKCAK